MAYGCSAYKPSTAAMEDFRRHISAYPDEFLNLIKTTEEAVGQSVLANCYKRPKPTDNEDLAPFFAWKDRIGCIRHLDFGPETFGPELQYEVSDFFTKLTPLYHFFNQFKS